MTETILDKEIKLAELQIKQKELELEIERVKQGHYQMIQPIRVAPLFTYPPTDYHWFEPWGTPKVWC